jgi:hypothetical protein
MAFDLGTVCCRVQLRQQEILKFSSRIIMAEKERLIPQVGPVDRLFPSQLMSLRQGHQDALAPQRQGVAVKDVSPVGRDDNVDCTIA